MNTTTNTTCHPYSTTRAARRYVSPRTRPLNDYERETRALSYMLKDTACPEAALQIAAAEMAALVWGPCHLIPAPDHTGDTTANRRLAKAIAAHVKGGADVLDILTRTEPAPSACDRHREKGPAVSVAEHHIARKDGKPNPEQPKTLHMIKSVSPCGCVVKHELCACVPNGEYPGTCEASYSNDKAKQLGKFDQSVCTYAIKVPLEKACCPAGGPCPKP